MNIPYTPVNGGILSEREIITVLNLDNDYPFTDRLETLSLEATYRLNTMTNHDWSADETVNELAKGYCRDYIYSVWYGNDDHLDSRMKDTVILLQAMVRTGDLDE